MPIPIPPHNILSPFHLDTLTATVVRGDLLIGNSTPLWSRLAIGASGKYLKSDGIDASWQDAPSASPGGSDTQVQFNDSSTFGGDAGFTFIKGTGTLLATIYNVGSTDLILKRAAAAKLQLGSDVNGTAVSQTVQAANGITGTDRVGGNFTLASGLGTGAGAVSQLIFQTPTILASGTTAQTLTTRLSIDSTRSYFRDRVDIDGVVFLNNNTANIVFNSGGQRASLGSTVTNKIFFQRSSNAQRFAVNLTVDTQPSLDFSADGSTYDLVLLRQAAATLQLGLDINGTAVSQVINAANGITGTDKIGGSFTIASGKGTGAGTVSQVLIQTPTVLVSGTTAQSLATRLTIDSNGIKATGYLSSDGSTGVTAGPYTVITAITIKNGLITAITGS